MASSPLISVITDIMAVKSFNSDQIVKKSLRVLVIIRMYSNSFFKLDEEFLLISTLVFKENIFFILAMFFLIKVAFLQQDFKLFTN